MISKFQFIIRDYEMPLLDNNEEWTTNIWVYFTTGVIGALTGMSSLKFFFTGATFAQAAGVVLSFGLLYTLVVWAGCTISAFYNIPEVKYAVSRSIFNLIAVALVFVVCAALGVIAMLMIIILLASVLLAAGGRRGSKSSGSSPDVVYDENGCAHYVSQSIGSDRVHTTDGSTMRREADGTYREL